MGADMDFLASIAQWIEQGCSRPLVEGSSPSRRAIYCSKSLNHSRTIAANSSASLTSLSNRALAHSASVCVVLFHIAGGIGFKKTIKKDEMPKALLNAA